MLTPKKKKEYYQALINKNTQYEGVFYVGVKTTGVFCRPTCPARKPKFSHCEFFVTAEEALLASFRPCKRCCPLSHPDQVSETIQKLVQAIEVHPEKRWMNSDFKQLAIDASTARRQFKKRFGMTFVAYARARRLGLAMKQIREGEKVIEAQLESGYESSSGFRDAFTKIMGKTPSLSGHCKIFRASWLDTPLGPMIAIADETVLYLLEFVDRRGLEREVERLRKRLKAAIIPGFTSQIQSIEHELKLYFVGQLRQFETPLFFLGSAFQKEVWLALKNIPYGETSSYTAIAKSIAKPLAARAVARANGANQFAIIIPCHRVIHSDGSLSGYGGGVARKQWLINHEKKHALK